MLLHGSNPHRGEARRLKGELIGGEGGRGVFMRETVEELRGEWGSQKGRSAV